MVNELYTRANRMAVGLYMFKNIHKYVCKYCNVSCTNVSYINLNRTGGVMRTGERFNRG